MGNPTVINSQVIFDHPWARIIVDTLEIQGIHRPYFVLESPVDAVATVGLTENQEIILTRQYRHPVGQTIYDLPAGRLEDDESPLEGARREFEEETGFRPGHIEALGSYNQFPGTLRVKTNLFFARDLVKTRQNLDEGEELQIMFKPVDEVIEMIRSGGLIDGSLQLGVLLSALKGLIPATFPSPD